MKKVLFCLSLIFGLLVLNQVPSFAMEFSLESIGGLGDLGYGLIGGATFDFDGTEYTIDDFDNLSETLKQQAAEQKAREFLQAYCMARGIPIPNIDPDLPATTGKEFYKSMYFDSANRTVWNNYKLGRTSVEQQDALRFPISPQAFNDWTGYSDFWYKKYIDQFTSEEDSPITPDIPSNLQDYIDLINNVSSTGFFWSNYNCYAPFDINWFSTQTGFDLDPSTHSYFVASDEWSNSSNIVVGEYSSSLIMPTDDIVTAYIDTTGENPSVYFTGFSYNEVTLNPYGIYPFKANSTTYNAPYLFTDDYLRVNSSLSSYYFMTNNYTYYFNNLSLLFQKLANKCRNINIIVDGVVWSSAGAIDPAPANPTIPTFPDIIGGNDEDPIPAYDIVFPNTSDYEGTFDITSLFDALKEAIIGASDSDDSTNSTLTREKVTDTYRDKVGEAVGEAVKTIDDVMEDSFPVEGTLNYPALPPIPQLPLDNAFAGTTILSELIDACQQILPSPLALAFWGMVFILFIIGLIRILHK